MIRYQDRWAVVTGASSGLGRGLAARLADRGMSLVLTGRNAARLEEAARRDPPRGSPGDGRDGCRRPRDPVRCVRAARSRRSTVRLKCWSTTPGLAATACLPSPTRTGRPTRWPSTSAPWSLSLARSCPGMLARGSGGILNVASTIAFQPAPYQAVYGASKAFVLSFSAGPVGRGAGSRRGGHRALSGSHPHGFRRRARCRRRPHGDLPPARRPRARHRRRAAGARQGPGRRHPRRAEQGDGCQRPVHAARVAHPGLRPVASSGQHGLAGLQSRSATRP